MALYKQNDAEALLATKEISIFEGNTVLNTDVPKKIAKEYVEGTDVLNAVHITADSNKLYKDISKNTVNRKSLFREINKHNET